MNTSIKKIVKVAIVGSPNVGKSSLLNRLVGYKNSIVSSTAHTTRDSVMGVCNNKSTQTVFMDTPGYIRKGSSCWADHFIRTTLDALKDANVILLIVDATNIKRYGTKELLTKFAPLDNCLIALNKVDVRSRGKLYEPVQSIAEMGYKNVVYLISSRTGAGIEDLKLAIAEFAVDGEWEFESNKEVMLPRELYAAECVREKIFYCMGQEIPFGVETEATEWSFDGAWRIMINIKVAKKSHKRMLIGYRGESVKRIGIAARTELEAMWGKGSLFTNILVADKS